MLTARTLRVGELIQQELMRLIQREMHDPRVGFATVTEVRMTADLRTARVYVSVLGAEEVQNESIAALQHAAGYLRTELSHALRLRRAPELHFVLDQSIEKSIRVEQLLHPEDKGEIS
ncbi:MAG: 30S ribosome-binding factor RbfA [Acidobacteria bacterium]|nr:30S ribosome-binding factor RbfA [Acidobacteriota bacterium]